MIASQIQSAAPTAAARSSSNEPGVISVGLGRIVEHRRAALDHAGRGLLGRAAGHVQQRHPAAGLRAERRDAAAHGPGAEHRDRFDLHASPPTGACST